MKWLVDNALSPALADVLNESGHDAVHARTLGLDRAPDEVVLQTAIEQHRIVISADTDFERYSSDSVRRSHRSCCFDTVRRGGPPTKRRSCWQTLMPSPTISPRERSWSSRETAFACVGSAKPARPDCVLPYPPVPNAC